MEGKSNKSLLPLGIFFISTSTLIFEITLVRIFSVILFSKTSFLAISVALFGLAFGGILVYIFPKYFNQANFQKRVSLFSFIYVVSTILYILFLASFDFFAREIGFAVTAVIFITAAIPFILANVVLTLIFKYKNKNINHLYFSDLLGAGLGVIIAVILLTYLSAINLIFITAIVGLLAAAIFNIKNKKLLLTAIIAGIILTPVIIKNEQNNFVKIKALYNRINKEKVNITYSGWNSFSNVTLDEEEQLPVVSLPGELDLDIPDKWGILIDAGAFTEIIKFNGDLKTVDYLNNDLSILGFKVASPGDVLVIGPGGGRDVLMALLSGHKVTGAEINPLIVKNIMLDRAKEFSGGLYERDDVNIVVSEGRSFISQNNNKYNVISIPLVDTWASTVAGNLALVENNLYTVEAFEDYLNHLKKDGILTISRWSLESLRLASLYIEAAKNLGIQSPEKNIVVVRLGNLDNFLFKINPFTAEEIAEIKKFTEPQYFSIQYLPGTNLDNDFNAYITNTDNEQFIKNYPYNISPVYDNQPFFFFTIPSAKLFTNINYLYSDGGLIITFITALFFTIILIVFPTLVKLYDNQNIKKNPKNQMLYIGYFGSLGLAFIFIELALIQKFILYLEQPIYSYSVILASILLASGVGSFLSKNINGQNKINFIRIIAPIFVLNLIYIVVIKNVIDATISLDLSNKIVIASLIVIPLSLMMGMLLPLGIKRLHNYQLDYLIPWSWAINGSTSVLGSVLAIILAIIWGFNVVLMLGGIIYLIAFIFILKTEN